MKMLSLTGFNLLYVGVVLFINGLWLLDKIKKEEIVFIDLFVGTISFLVAAYLVFSIATPQSINAGALTFLFSCTYLWVAYNQYTNADGHGLGWYCLFVAATAIPITYSLYKNADTVWEWWLVFCWGVWALLWFSYFINLVFGKIKQNQLGALTIFSAITTAWLPGYLLITGYLQ